LRFSIQGPRDRTEDEEQGSDCSEAISVHRVLRESM
jgi:hypothetical protein